MLRNAILSPVLFSFSRVATAALSIYLFAQSGAKESNIDTVKSIIRKPAM